MRDNQENKVKRIKNKYLVIRHDMRTATESISEIALLRKCYSQVKEVVKKAE